MSERDSAGSAVSVLDRSRPGRRAVVAGAAWAAPAIVMSLASPAYAASTASTLSLVVPGTVAVGTLPARAVFALVLTNSVPAAGVSVEFSVGNSALGGFGAAAAVTVETDSSGIAAPPAVVVKKTGSLVITATANGLSQTGTLTVVAPDSTGTMAFTSPSLNAPTDSPFALAGSLNRMTGNRYPSTATLAYPAGFSGPASVAIDPATGSFAVPGITARDAGVITASAPGFGTASVAISTVLGYLSTSQRRYSAGSGFSAPLNTYVITGNITRSSAGVPFPASVTAKWKNDASRYEYVCASGLISSQPIAVDQSTGEFRLPTLTATDSGKLVPGETSTYREGVIEITTPGYPAWTVRLMNYGIPIMAAMINRNSTQPPLVIFAPGETKDISGYLDTYGISSAYFVAYPAGFTGPRYLQPEEVRGSDGFFTLRGVKAPENIAYGDFAIKSWDSPNAALSVRGVFAVI